MAARQRQKRRGGVELRRVDEWSWVWKLGARSSTTNPDDELHYRHPDVLQCDC